MRLDGVLRAGLVRMLPRLQAEETIARANAVSIGRGPQSKRGVSAHKKAVNRLERAAAGVRPKAAPTREAFMESMKALGFNVIVQKPGGGEAT